ncbi:nuclear transport factor 2 family protein [Pedobacter agri]|uniref:hypothetical protein n=1 Tax=Pedobacter agri TaxID=454586 RepID=UPI002931B616|nr:hypothetical protein [Pedobacter agri]
MKTVLLFTFLSFFYLHVTAQMDTTSYPKERAEIRQVLRSQKPGVTTDCSDMIAVGPKGDISFSRQQWLAVQQKEKLTFKSVRPVPGNEYIRIYEGNIAMVNLLIEVNLLVNGQDISIKVRRLEVYHKRSGNWCRVAGQGTQVDEGLFPTDVSNRAQ